MMHPGMRTLAVPNFVAKATSNTVVQVLITDGHGPQDGRLDCLMSGWLCTTHQVCATLRVGLIRHGPIQSRDDGPVSSTHIRFVPVLPDNFGGDPDIYVLTVSATLIPYPSAHALSTTSLMVQPSIDPLP